MTTPNERLAEERDTAFDVTDAFEAEARPVWTQLYEIAKKHDVPCGFFACTAKVIDEQGDGIVAVGNKIVGMRHFNGPARTPDEFPVIGALLDRGLDGGMEVAMNIRLRGLLRDGVVDRKGTILSTEKDTTP